MDKKVQLIYKRKKQMICLRDKNVDVVKYKSRSLRWVLLLTVIMIIYRIN